MGGTDCGVDILPVQLAFAQEHVGGVGLVTRGVTHEEHLVAIPVNTTADHLALGHLPVISAPELHVYKCMCVSTH